VTIPKPDGGQRLLSIAAWKVMASVSRFVTRKLKLVVNETKGKVRRADGAEFLGFEFRSRKAKVAVSRKKMLRLKSRVRESRKALPDPDLHDRRATGTVAITGGARTHQRLWDSRVPSANAMHAQ